MDIAEKRLPQNGTIMHQNKWHTYDLRLSTLPTKVTESLAIRLIPKDIYPTVERLFLFPTQAKALLGWIKNNQECCYLLVQQDLAKLQLCMHYLENQLNCMVIKLLL